jgi:hypothetical protein
MTHWDKFPADKQILYEYEVIPPTGEYRGNTDAYDTTDSSGNSEVSIVHSTTRDMDNHLFSTGERRVLVSAITTGLYPRRCRVFLVNTTSPGNIPNLSAGENTNSLRADEMNMRIELLEDAGAVINRFEAGSEFAETYTVRGQNAGLQTTLYSLRVSSGGRTVLLPLTSVR